MIQNESTHLHQPYTTSNKSREVGVRDVLLPLPESEILASHHPDPSATSPPLHVPSACPPFLSVTEENMDIHEVLAVDGEPHAAENDIDASIHPGTGEDVIPLTSVVMSAFVLDRFDHGDNILGGHV